MSANVVLLVTVGCMYAAGVYLLLERSLTRILLAILILGNATNLLVLSSGGRAGGAPITGVTEKPDMSDPLAQAMILTAIVITLGMAAFFLSVIHRGWTLDQAQGDFVEDDSEDRLVAASGRDVEAPLRDQTDAEGNLLAESEPVVRKERP